MSTGKHVLLLAALFFTVDWIRGSEAMRIQEVKAVVESSIKAYAERNLKQLEDLFDHHNPDFLFFESGYADRGWYEFSRNHLLEEVLFFRNVKYTIRDLKVNARDPHVAFATFCLLIYSRASTL